MARREAVAALRLLARALVLRRAPASDWSPDDRITLDAFLQTPTGGRFYDALALLAVTAALRGVEERPFDAGVTAGMGGVVREIDGMRGKRGGSVSGLPQPALAPVGTTGFLGLTVTTLSHSYSGPSMRSPMK